MSKKLFLSSSFEDVVTLLPEFEKNLVGKKVTFIPTASIVEQVAFFVESGKKALEELGLIVDELELSTATAEEIESKITNNDIIYVTGGNTFFLLQEMIRTGADKLIINEVNSGKLYIGESAGAMILAPNIEYAKDMDDHLTQTPDFTDFKGLGIVEFYPVVHFNSSPFEEAAQKVVHKNSHLPLEIITNQQAIVVVGNSIVIKERK